VPRYDQEVKMEMPWFQRTPSRPLTGRGRRAPRRVALLALCCFALALAAPRTPAQGRAVPKEVQLLLSSDPDTWLPALDALRRLPNARELLVQALQAPSERRWRVIHALGMLGAAEDVPALAGLLGTSQEPLERRVLLGALQALLPPPPPNADLSTLIRDPVYVPGAAPSAIRSNQDDRFVVTELDLKTLHLDRIPVRVVERMYGLRGRSFESRAALKEAIQSRLTPKQAQDFGDRLVAPVLQFAPRAAAEGVVRYRVENPLTQPLLLTIDLGATSGRLEEAVPTRTLYLQPGQAAQIDQPVRVSGPREPGKVRIDIQPRSIQGLRIPEVFKVYVPLQG
jgi:hypothetical protein